MNIRTKKSFLNLLKQRVGYRLYTEPHIVRWIETRFHKLFYGTGVPGGWKSLYWLGIKTQKNPFDLWIYQEILSEQRPDVIVECGTYRGGSALFLAGVCDLLGTGQVITIDTEQPEGLPRHHRIEYLHGSSTSLIILETLKNMIREGSEVMVILDSDHHKDHVVKELELYSQMVTKGQYLIVEDTNINGHPIYADFGPGPMEAIKEFLKTDPGFVVDKRREKLHLTFNPGGYLRKIK